MKAFKITRQDAPTLITTDLNLAGIYACLGASISAFDLTPANSGIIYGPCFLDCVSREQRDALNDILNEEALNTPREAYISATMGR